LTKADLLKQLNSKQAQEMTISQPETAHSFPNKSETVQPSAEEQRDNTDLHNPPTLASDALTTKQKNAIDLLITGMNDQETAKRVRVSRETVCNWRNHNPRFIAALEHKRHALMSVNADRLRRLSSKAIDVLENAMDSETYNGLPYRQKAAVHILRACGLYGKPILPPSRRPNKESVVNALTTAFQQARIEALEKSHAQSPHLKKIEDDCLQAISELLASRQSLAGDSL